MPRYKTWPGASELLSIADLHAGERIDVGVVSDGGERREKRGGQQQSFDRLPVLEEVPAENRWSRSHFAFRTARSMAGSIFVFELGDGGCNLAFIDGDRPVLDRAAVLPSEVVAALVRERVAGFLRSRLEQLRHQRQVVAPLCLRDGSIERTQAHDRPMPDVSLRNFSRVRSKISRYFLLSVAPARFVGS